MRRTPPALQPLDVTCFSFLTVQSDLKKAFPPPYSMCEKLTSPSFHKDPARVIWQVTEYLLYFLTDFVYISRTRVSPFYGKTPFSLRTYDSKKRRFLWKGLLLSQDVNLRSTEWRIFLVILQDYFQGNLIFDKIIVCFLILGIRIGILNKGVPHGANQSVPQLIFQRYGH